ncbi:MAG: acyl-CoA dehydrogenase family protein [Candidatus Thermoplasmatota archaeon]|nr:acyl-CoA dehydrogenase family protein [Candidatus Sysuiplasma jiujiangense]MCL4317797.1 acyl-CoA dehydrogenase family protein [Candidatus Thermoplasmatota archaeon]MCL5254150.1 acyl-CoA dehydrogenase family protein [Candidatus Thermoplasmatota archaeon]
MVDFSFSEEQELLRESARKFFETELRPLSAQIDREARFPSEIISRMAGMGYMGVPIPEEYGGAGLGKTGYCILLEELGRVDASVCTILSAHCSLGSIPLLYFGNEEQKQKYLIPAAKGTTLHSFNLSEPGAGSDASSIQTTATKEGHSYVINGTKLWATNGKEADVYIVFAATDRKQGAAGGLTAFIVERKFGGIKFGREEEKMGIRGSSTMQLFYDNVSVPEENVLGRIGDGFRIAMTTLDVGRITLSAGSLGASSRAIELALAYAKNRIQFGRSIAEFQAIQFKLAEMGIRTEALRYFLYNVAARADALGTDVSAWPKSKREDLTREAAMLKTFASETASFCVDESLQIHGGTGFIKTSEIERMYRDARIAEIYEGTNEIQRMVIGRDMARRGWH